MSESFLPQRNRLQSLPKGLAFDRNIYTNYTEFVLNVSWSWLLFHFTIQIQLVHHIHVWIVIIDKHRWNRKYYLRLWLQLMNISHHVQHHMSLVAACWRSSKDPLVGSRSGNSVSADSSTAFRIHQSSLSLQYLRTTLPSFQHHLRPSPSPCVFPFHP